MGLLDKVKAVAKDVAVEAKKGTATLQGKLETGQLRKKADENAKQLGYLIVRERTEGTPAGEEADRLVGEIAGIEAQIKTEQDDTAAKIEAHEASRPAGEDAGPAAGVAPTSAPEGAPAPPPSTSAAEPQEGNFTLE
ncbi:MAG TPA: hypothetical protein VEN82_03695 [Actinomycetota bacterium]|nr:hypothetical protein [Actinomycetota bacterium]